MSTRKNNFIYQTAYQILTMILPLITSPYVSRILGAEGIGIYSFTYTMANYFVLFAMLGINNHGNRIIARTRDNRKELNESFSNLYVLHFINAVVVLAAYIVYAIFFASQNKLFVLIQISYLIGAVFDINWFFFGLEQFKLTVIRNTIIKLLTCICIFAFVRSSNDLWIYLMIMGVGSLLSQVILWGFVKRYVTFVKPEWDKIKEHIKPLIYMFLPVLAVSLYKMMDKIMLGVISSEIQLGFYENSSKIIDIPAGIITAFGTVMLPYMSNLAAKSQDKIAAQIKNSIFYIAFISCALGFGLASISDNFSVVFWGEEFAECAVIMILLAMHVPFQAYNNVIRTQYLIPCSLDKKYLTSVVCGAIANVCFNIWLIPIYQARGAAIGTLIAEIVVFSVQNYHARKALPCKKFIVSYIPFIIFGTIMFAAVRIVGMLMGQGIVTLIVQIAAGGCVYIVCCVVYLTVTGNELFNSLVSNNKYLKKIRFGAKNDEK